MTHDPTDYLAILIIILSLAGIIAAIYHWAPRKYKLLGLAGIGIIGAILAGGIALLSRKKKPAPEPDPMPQHVPAPWIDESDKKTTEIKEKVDDIKSETKRQKASGGLTDGRADQHVFDVLSDLDE